MALSMALAALLFFMPPNRAAAGIIDVEDKEIEQQKSRAASLVDLDDPVLHLNRFSFHKTVLEEQSRNQVKNWIVLFCPAWFEPCQALDPHYRRIASHWQEHLNKALLSTEVRFAAVDCATEKALCNTQNVGMNYPMVWHYRDHEQVASWNGQSIKTDSSQLMHFLTQEFANKGDDSAPQTDEDNDFQEEDEASGVRKDLLLIFVAIAGNALVISRSQSHSNETPRNTGACEEAAPEKPARTLAARATAARDGESISRLLPKEWTRDRPSIEL
mmetsp:Transcript_6872/g.13146  ORF Transcript_6872/g.13146 Transcript_6872/m.13146 type:complete len:273 (+) Transcript_6872:69-887(+)